MSTRLTVNPSLFKIMSMQKMIELDERRSDANSC